MINDINKDGLGMDGLDPVSHYLGQPLKGQAEYSFSLRGTTYLFANEENQMLFEKDPAKYMPIAGAYSSTSGQTQKTLHYRKDLEDQITSTVTEIPTEMKEETNMEMQNLSDSPK